MLCGPQGVLACLLVAFPCWARSGIASGHISQVYKADEALRQLNEGDVFGERCLLEVCKRHALATSDAAAA